MELESRRHLSDCHNHTVLGFVDFLTVQIVVSTEVKHGSATTVIAVCFDKPVFVQQTRYHRSNSE